MSTSEIGVVPAAAITAPLPSTPFPETCRTGQPVRIPAESSAELVEIHGGSYSRERLTHESLTHDQESLIVEEGGGSAMEPGHQQEDAEVPQVKIKSKQTQSRFRRDYPLCSSVYLFVYIWR